jgi:hypothetical protein
MSVSSSRPDDLHSSEQKAACALGPDEAYATPEQSAAADAAQLKMLDVQEIADR